MFLASGAEKAHSRKYELIQNEGGNDDAIDGDGDGNVDNDNSAKNLCETSQGFKIPSTKKRKCHGMTEEESREERRAANRRSAFESRLRRKILIDDLQDTVQMLSKENAAIRKEADMLRQERDTVIRENRQLRLQQQIGTSISAVQNKSISSVFNNNNISHQRGANQGPMGGLVASQHQGIHSHAWLPGNQIPTGLSHTCVINQREHVHAPSRDPFAPNDIGNFGPRLHGLSGMQDQHVHEFISSRSHQNGIQKFLRPHTITETQLNGQMMDFRELSRKFSPSHEANNKL